MHLEEYVTRPYMILQSLKYLLFELLKKKVYNQKSLWPNLGNIISIMVTIYEENSTCNYSVTSEAFEKIYSSQ